MEMLHQGHRTLNKALFSILIILVLGAIIALVFVINAEPRERFTEFYILNSAGKASSYPSVIKTGIPAEVILGIVNREQQVVSYKVEIRIDGEKKAEMGPIVLEHRSKFEYPVSFTVDVPGERQKVEFLLYRQGDAEAFESIYLWVDVKS